MEYINYHTLYRQAIFWQTLFCTIYLQFMCFQCSITYMNNKTSYKISSLSNMETKAWCKSWNNWVWCLAPLLPLSLFSQCENLCIEYGTILHALLSLITDELPFHSNPPIIPHNWNLPIHHPWKILIVDDCFLSSSHCTAPVTIS
jgi:hypothetical protein